MKVICDRTALQNAVNHIGAVTVHRSPTPVLACVRLTAADGRLVLAATDLEVSLKTVVEQVDVQKAGEALVPADKLTQIVRSCEDPTLTIEVKDHTVHVKSSHAHFKVFGYDPKEAPVLKEFVDKDVDFSLDGGSLQRLITRTLFAAATEHTRYAINGVLIEREGKKLRFVATDGRRLAVARGDCTPGSRGEAKRSCIIPTKALNLVNRIIADPDAPVRVSLNENNALFAIGEPPDAAIITTNLVEGTFPPFEDVIPKDQDKKVTFDTAALSSAIRQASLLTNEESRGVRMAFADNKLTVTSRAPDMGEAEIQLDVEKYTGDPVEIGFNPSFIADALKVLDTDQVMIELKAANKPGVLKTGNDFTYVVMPVNLQ